jgi:hypothetical protein
MPNFLSSTSRPPSFHSLRLRLPHGDRYAPHAPTAFYPIGDIARNRAAARHPEPYGRRRLGGTRHMPVGCDGGAGAQAGVLNRNGRTLRPNRALGNTHRGLSFAIHGGACCIISKYVTKLLESAPGCRRRRRDFSGKYRNFRRFFAEKGGHHHAAQSPVACVRWVEHGA